MQPTPAPPPIRRATSHRGYAALLDRYVDVEGQTDYAAWNASAADVEALDQYVDELLAHPPAGDAERYPTQSHRLAYWLNLYNAISIREILRRWPVDTVDNRALFADLAFEVGEETMTLADIEMRLVRNTFADPRAHFAMSCGARSCPLLPRSPFDGVDLDARLDAAARAFINRPDQVRVDHDGRRVLLSSLFGWYRADFMRAAEERLEHPAPTLIDYLRSYAEPALAESLARAQRSRYRIELIPYDWSLRGDLRALQPKRAPEELLSADLGPLPDATLELVNGEAVTTGDLAGRVTIIDFWATWCRPCLLSFPMYAELLLEHEKRGLRVIAVAQDEGRGPVDAFVKDNDVAVDVAFDAQHRLATLLSITTLPTVLVVDRQGTIRFRLEGYDGSRHRQLEARIQELLEEPPPVTGSAPP